MENRSTRIFYNWDAYFIWSKLKIKRKIEQQYFRIRGAYYTRKYGYFDILGANVGIRIIRGCVLYPENNSLTQSNVYSISSRKPLQHAVLWTLSKKVSLFSRNIKNPVSTFMHGTLQLALSFENRAI